MTIKHSPKLDEELKKYNGAIGREAEQELRRLKAIEKFKEYREYKEQLKLGSKYLALVGGTKEQQKIILEDFKRLSFGSTKQIPFNEISRDELAEVKNPFSYAIYREQYKVGIKEFSFHNHKLLILENLFSLNKDTSFILTTVFNIEPEFMVITFKSEKLFSEMPEQWRNKFCPVYLNKNKNKKGRKPSITEKDLKQAFLFVKREHRDLSSYLPKYFKEVAKHLKDNYSVILTETTIRKRYYEIFPANHKRSKP